MSTKNAYHWTILLLIVCPLVFSSWKVMSGKLSNRQFLPETTYQVQFQFTADSLVADQDYSVRSYIPVTNTHQSIRAVNIQQDNLQFQEIPAADGNRYGQWAGQAQQAQDLRYAFTYEGHALRYELSPFITYIQTVPDTINRFLAPTDYIQSDDAKIAILAHDLRGKDAAMPVVLRSFYDFVMQIPVSNTSELTDAITTLEQNEASCNGKSRLLAALCRASGIPARVVGGLILEQTEKRTSHLWTEVWIQDKWVPMDALNGHFAYLPAHYLELYRGDEFLIKRTAEMNFDYVFAIDKVESYASKEAAAVGLWNLVDQANMPIGALKVILLLPLCALVVGLFRNVVGLKTIGVFLPAIIAVSLDGVGLWYGMAAYLMVVGWVALLHFPLDKWGILHTPKLIIMLTAVVLSLLLMSSIGWASGQPLLSMAIGFPIIVLTIAAEKFARTILEEGFQEAVKLQLQTMLLTLACYLVYQADFLLGYLLSFPETYLLLLAILLLLGRWIGLRLNEYIRFRALSA